MTRQWLIGAGALALVLGIVLGGLGAMAFEDDREVTVDTVSTAEGADQSPGVSQFAGGSGLTPTAESTVAPTAELTPPSPSTEDASPTPTLPPVAAPTPSEVITAPPTATPEPLPPPTAAAAPIGRQVDSLRCDDRFVAVTAVFGETASDVQAIDAQLANEPQSRVAAVADSCEALVPEGGAAYVTYIGPFGNSADACVTKNNAAPDGGYVAWLAAENRVRVSCPPITGYAIYQSRFYQVEVPAESTIVDHDLDVGYGFRSRVVGSGFFVTVETTPGVADTSSEAMRKSAVEVAARVPGQPEVRSTTIEGTEAWYFEWFDDDGHYKTDIFFYAGGNGHAVVGASEGSKSVAFGLAYHAVATIRPNG